MARRSRIRRAGRMGKMGSNKVDGLDHPQFTASHFKRVGEFNAEGEKQLKDQERFLKKLDRMS